MDRNRRSGCVGIRTIATLGSRLGTIIVWAFNIIGTVDLLNAFYQGNRLGVGITPGLQGAAYSFPPCSCRFSS
jgi:hypothetical protein